MAKFSIALCILLVACGAQATTISSSSVTAWLEAREANIEELLQSASAALSNATATAESMIASIQSTMQTSLDDWNTMVEEAMANYVNASSCLSASVNFTEVATELFTEVIDCVQDLSASNKAKYEAAVNSSEALITDMQGVVTEAVACTENLLTSGLCIVELVASEGSSIMTAYSTLAEEIAELTVAFGSISSNLQSCGYSAALQTVVTEGQEAYATIQECLSNLNSTSS